MRTPISRVDRRRAERGSVMVITLVVLAGLVALMATLAAGARVSIQREQDQLRRRRAELAVHAAVARALSDIQQATTTSVTLNDIWAQDGDMGNTVFDMGDSATTFRMQIIDACSRLNLNAASSSATGGIGGIGVTAAQQALVRRQIAQLPLTQQQSDSLLDWISSGQTARASGAKDDYYNGLSVPYYTKLGRLNALDDLLLIQGWTASTLYSTQPNDNVVSTAVTLQDANGNTIPLIDLFTVDGACPTTTNGRTTRVEGKINVNTATAAVLETIPAPMTAAIANQIVAQQTTGFTSLNTFRTAIGLTTQQFNQLSSVLGVGSDTWIVRAYGESGGVGVAVEAVIGMRTPTTSTTGTTTAGTTGTTGATGAQARILNWSVQPSTGVPTWWIWNDQPTGSANAGDSPSASAGVRTS